MAAHVASISRAEYDESWAYRTPAPGEGEQPRLLRYSYYTAGTGGAGPTILATSLLLAGEEAVVFRDGKRYALPAVSQRREVDFGPGVGRKGLWLYNLPEVASSHVNLKARAPRSLLSLSLARFIARTLARWLAAFLLSRRFRRLRKTRQLRPSIFFSPPPKTISIS